MAQRGRVSADKSRRGQRTSGAAEAAREAGNPSGILGAQRADGHARYAAGADAPVELSGGRGRFDTPIEPASEDRWVRTNLRG